MSPSTTTASIADESTRLLARTEGDALTTVRSQSSATLSSIDDFTEVDDIDTGTMLRQEAALLAKTSLPVVLTYLLQYSFSFITLLVLGHIGANELAAAALGNMALVVIVYSPCIGLASALDTFCSTAFTASRDKTLVGFHLQRGIIAVTIHLILIAPVLWHLDSILIWFKQDIAVSLLCGRFIRVQLLGALAWMLFECIKRFLQAQGIMHVSTYVLLLVMPIHLANNYLLVWSPLLGFGFMGAAVANVLTNWLILAGLLAYACNSKASASWGGWTVRALTTMPQYFQLALPSMIMVCCEWWILDLLALAASYLGNTTLAAQSIVINTCSLTYQLPDGLSVALCNHVGNLVGQARERRAKLSAYLGLALGTAVGVLTLVAAIAVGSWWGRIYSDDERIVNCVAMIMPACALFQMVDAINSVGSGVLRSLGRQNLGALINFPAYYLLGFPLGLYLTYGAPNVGVLGLWYGICASVSVAVVMQLTICLRTDWDVEIRRCMVRVSKDHTSHTGTYESLTDQD
ncbi:ethionine resistance protein [Coemansia sp. S16]|nr:ethionine resistance protein [Coemansia sp. S16]KAJ2067420.1 ethionine resistance protein [Coemansia sp. S155-1]